MSKFLFTCPQCNQQLEAEEEWIGMQTECPYCKQTITIEKLQASPAAVLRASAPDEKTCPFCGEIIKKEAVFCKHCKRDLIEPKKIKMTCQYCAEEVEIPENQQGNIVCPSCGKILPVQQNKFQKTGSQVPIQSQLAMSAVSAAITEKPCPLCGQLINSNADFCRFCKKDISRVGTFKATCPKCSETLDVDYGTERKKVQCPFCGAMFRAISEQSKDMDFARRGLLMCGATFAGCLFAGWIGIIAGIVGIIFSIFAAVKFSDHPNEKLKKYALMGIIANIIAIVLAIMINVIVIQAIRNSY